MIPTNTISIYITQQRFTLFDAIGVGDGAVGLIYSIPTTRIRVSPSVSVSPPICGLYNKIVRARMPVTIELVQESTSSVTYPVSGFGTPNRDYSLFIAAAGVVLPVQSFSASHPKKESQYTLQLVYFSSRYPMKQTLAE